MNEIRPDYFGTVNDYCGRKPEQITNVKKKGRNEQTKEEHTENMKVSRFKCKEKPKTKWKENANVGGIKKTA